MFIRFWDSEWKKQAALLKHVDLSYQAQSCLCKSIVEMPLLWFVLFLALFLDQIVCNLSNEVVLLTIPDAGFHFCVWVYSFCVWKMGRDKICALDDHSQEKIFLFWLKIRNTYLFHSFLQSQQNFKNIFNHCKCKYNVLCIEMYRVVFWFSYGSLVIRVKTLKTCESFICHHGLVQ